MEYQEYIPHKLAEITDSLSAILPEICLCVIFILIVLTDLFNNNARNSKLAAIAMFGVFLSGYFTLIQLSEINQLSGSGFLGMLYIDTFAIYFKLLFLLAALLTIIFTNISGQFKRVYYGEFLAILFLVLIGLNLLVASRNLLMIYLTIEFVSIGSYILTLFNFNKQSSEAGLKYFVFGAVSSAFMLYGMSFLYGISGTLEINEVLLRGLQEIPAPAAAIILGLTLSGFLFKIGIFPFHTWVPDVYQAAPTPIVAFFSIAPKAAGLAIMIRLLYPIAGTLFSIDSIVLPVALLAAATLTIGNFAAISQRNAKRLLAYSSIAHAGFVLCGFVCFSETGILSIIIYLSIYLIMNFTAFFLVDHLSKQVGTEDVRKFAGLGVKLPLIGVIFVITAVALTGLPPTAGFYAKLFVFTALWESFQNTGNNVLLFLLLFGVFNAVISLFYYLRIPYIMYFKKTDNEVSIKDSLGTNMLLTVLAFLMLLLFFSPEWLINYLNSINLNLSNLPL